MNICTFLQICMHSLDLLSAINGGFPFNVLSDSYVVCRMTCEIVKKFLD